MAYDDNGEWVDENYEEVPYDDNAHNQIDQPANDPGEAPAQAGSSPARYTEEDFKSKLGDLYTPGAYEEYQHRDYDNSYGDRIIAKEQLRGNNEVGSTYHEDGKGGYLTGPKQPASALLGAASGQLGSSFSKSNPKADDIYGYLKGLFPGGGFNQDVVNRRVDSARTQLEAQKKSALKNNEAYLAERGLAGSGPQADAANSLESRLFGQFGSQLNDIYANESEAADRRMIQALQTAAGMSAEEARNYVDQYRAETERDLGNKNIGLGYYKAGNDYELGRGNLALGNYEAGNQYDLGLQRLGLDKEQLQKAIAQGDTDAMLKYLQLLLQYGEGAAGGYVPR